MCDGMAVIYECVAYSNPLYASFCYELLKTLFTYVYSQYDYTYWLRQRRWHLEWLRNFIPILILRYTVYMYFAQGLGLTN